MLSTAHGAAAGDLVATSSRRERATKRMPAASNGQDMTPQPRKEGSMRIPILAAAVVFVCACGTATGSGGPSPASPSPSPVALSCTPSGAASPSWPSPQTAGAGPAITSAVVSGDSMQLTFASGTPQFRVEPQSSAAFTLDPSGAPVSLAGTAGVRIVLVGFPGDRSNYSGQTSLASSGPLLLQANKLGDFEGVVTFGAGVSGPACANVTASGPTLTFRFIPAA